MVGAEYVIIAFLGVVIALFVFYNKYFSTKEYINPNVDLKKFIVHVHESGHLITAWYCSAVWEVEKASIKESRVTYKIFDIKDPDILWASTVIALGGIAAEIIVFNKMRSSGASQDLKHALARIQALLSMNPKYKEKEKVLQTINFNKIFYGGLTKKENHLMKLAYTQSKQTILKHEKEFYKSISALIHFESLDTAQLTTLLTTRTPLKIISSFTYRFF